MSHRLQPPWPWSSPAPSCPAAGRPPSPCHPRRLHVGERVHRVIMQRKYSTVSPFWCLLLHHLKVFNFKGKKVDKKYTHGAHVGAHCFLARRALCLQHSQHQNHWPQVEVFILFNSSVKLNNCVPIKHKNLRFLLQSHMCIDLYNYYCCLIITL